MICITGDIHGDLRRFKNPILRKLKKHDALIICGDFGFIWNGSKQEKRILKKLGKKKYNVLFVDGCHENYDLLENYSYSEWCGGKTRQISGKLRMLMRGQVFEIAGKRIFTFGGGQSNDNEAHIDGENWWEREAPTEKELSEGIENLNRYDFEVDYIITHEPPSLIREFMDIGTTDRNHLNTYLNNIREKATFEHWFFGKSHINKLIPPKYHSIFDNVIMIDKTKIKKKKGELIFIK